MTRISEGVAAALIFAAEAHHSIKQERHYGHRPYIVHPIAVTSNLSLYETADDLVKAAPLHDVLEDVFPFNPVYNLEAIVVRFGSRTGDYVIDVTDVFTRRAYPTKNRKWRHEAEVERLSSISAGGQSLKLADIVDNTKDIVSNDPNFARVYLHEIERVLAVLTRGNPDLFSWAVATLEEGQRTLAKLK